MLTLSQSHRLSSVAKATAFLLLTLCFSFVCVAQVNLLYINSNVGLCPTCQANTNQILAFTVDPSTGKMTRLKGPFKTLGDGVYNNPPGNEVEADQQIIINPEGTLLFAVNGHSNTVAVFTINAGGTLTAVAGSPFNSNGPQPASLGLLEDPNIGGGNSILIVANKDNDPLQPQTQPNFSSFFVTPTGTLTLVPSATVLLPQGSSPSQALINTKGDLLFGQLFVGSAGQGSITSYRIKTDGSLAAQSTVTTPNSGKFFLGMAQHPINSALYAGLPDQSLIGVYRFGVGNGMIFFNSTVPNSGTLPCWLTVNKSGTRLYVSETQSSTVSVYDVTNSLAPVQLQHLTLTSGGSFGALNLALDPTEKLLFVLTGTTLHTLSVLSDGTLSEIFAARPLPLSAGTVPTGLATLMK